MKLEIDRIRFENRKEIEVVVNVLAEWQEEHRRDETIQDLIDKLNVMSSCWYASDVDPLFVEAGRMVIRQNKASIGALQRVYKIGFSRAARIVDQLTDAGVIGAEEGTKARTINMSIEEFEKYLSDNNISV